MSLNNQIDFIDRQILKILQEDGRAVYRVIADKLRISNSLVHQRIRKLKENGVLVGTTAKINSDALGLSTLSFTGITLTEARYSNSIMKALEDIPEVESAYFISGKYAIMCQVRCRDNSHLHHVLYTLIHNIEGVGGTDSFICFQEGFDRQLSL